MGWGGFCNLSGRVWFKRTTRIIIANVSATPTISFSFFLQLIMGGGPAIAANSDGYSHLITDARPWWKNSRECLYHRLARAQVHSESPVSIGIMALNCWIVLLYGFSPNHVFPTKPSASLITSSTNGYDGKHFRCTNPIYSLTSATGSMMSMSPAQPYLVDVLVNDVDDRWVTKCWPVANSLWLPHRRQGIQFLHTVRPSLILLFQLGLLNAIQVKCVFISKHLYQSSNLSRILAHWPPTPSLHTSLMDLDDDQPSSSVLPSWWSVLLFRRLLYQSACSSEHGVSLPARLFHMSCSYLDLSDFWLDSA